MNCGSPIASPPTLDEEPGVVAAAQGGMSTLADWILLQRQPGVGAATFHRLLDEHGGPAEALAALRRAGRAPVGEADIAADLAWAERPGQHVITWDDRCYPARLREIPNPPPLLYVRGDPDLLALPQLAVVGSRSPSPDGRANAREFAAHFARCGLVVTSGLALGVDGAAHEGALHAQGATVAVLGCGVDRVYPARHLDLARRIVEGGGALVSELPLGTRPRREFFPARNRIISGLSLGVLVVEAAVHSGSLITARLAGEQGREVFAIPGSIHNPMARGCHRLIREGAKLVETAADVLEELGPLLGLGVSSPPTAPLEAVEPADDPALPDDPDHRAVLDALGYEPCSVDQVVARTGLKVEAVASILLVLELQGFVASASGGLYSRIHRRSR